MKKILLLGSLQSGGSEHQMVVIATLLKEEGYDVTYLCGDTSDFYKKDLETVEIPVIRINENKLVSALKLTIVRSLIIIRRIIKRNKYDTVISFLGEWNFYNCLTSKWPCTKHRAITGIRNNRDEVFLWRRERFYCRFEKYAFKKVSNSDAAKNKFAQYYPQFSSKLKTIYFILIFTPTYHFFKKEPCIWKKNI